MTPSRTMAGLVRKGAMNEGRGGVRLVPGLAVRAGQTIAGKYRVEELIGSGPSGVVISARNIHLREQVTLKILASYTDGQKELLQRRLKKARLAARLQSPHVARIVDIGFTEERMPYIATEALEGVTLEIELAERGVLTVEEAARWVLEACEGLAEAHAAGLVHGDLKPQNIFLAQPKVTRARSPVSPAADDPLDTDPRVLKILDFGTTSPLDAIGDQSASAFFGSPAFVAPEQIQAPATVDARADVWALGVLLYNLVSGSLPFEADCLSGVIVAVVYDAPRLLTDAPYELARLVHRCLDKDPANRPRDVRELAVALAPFAGAIGARSSERVHAMLDAGSIAPVSLSSSDDDDLALDVLEVEEPLPLVVTKPAPQARRTEGRAPRTRATQSTRPSQRIRAQRRARARMAVFAALGGIAALALTGWAATRASTLPSMSIAAPAEVSITSAPLSAARPATNAALPDDAPRAPATESKPITEVSFAATSADGLTPTPLAVTPTPLATGEQRPPEPAPFVLPAPRSVTPGSLPNAPPSVPSPRGRAAPAAPRATPPLRLPPGLPTSREALPPYGATSGRPISRNDAAPPPPPPSLKDESYLRKLISDRK
jgi:serine/threonine protein kinase